MTSQDDKILNIFAGSQGVCAGGMHYKIIKI
jgi:hypothetical protein